MVPKQMLPVGHGQGATKRVFSGRYAVVIDGSSVPGESGVCVVKSSLPESLRSSTAIGEVQFCLRDHSLLAVVPWMHHAFR